MKKTMFPRNFVIWFFDHYKDYLTFQIDNGALKYGLACDHLPQGTLDDLYKHWLFEVEPKTKEDENT